MSAVQTISMMSPTCNAGWLVDATSWGIEGSVGRIHGRRWLVRSHHRCVTSTFWLRGARLGPVATWLSHDEHSHALGACSASRACRIRARAFLLDLLKLRIRRPRLYRPMTVSALAPLRPCESQGPFPSMSESVCDAYSL